ncbi:hypothetical protein CRYUN_Cryun09bG0077000 [Craigia yunnanensis]
MWRGKGRLLEFCLGCQTGSVAAWLLFRVCACLSSLIEFVDVNPDDDDKIEEGLADGRCLFRAIAHRACLRSEEEAPHENRQRELADDLRAQVANELLKRREETEWSIEGDFDAYLKEIQQPYVWGGEPEITNAFSCFEVNFMLFLKHLYFYLEFDYEFFCNMFFCKQMKK